MENTKAYINARRKARLLKDLYAHLGTYFTVNGLLFLVNILTSPSELWVLYPVIGWGVCLTINILDTILKINSFWDKWEENKTEELIRKEQYK
jgi:hypothetical protein